MFQYRSAATNAAAGMPSQLKGRTCHRGKDRGDNAALNAEMKAIDTLTGANDAVTAAQNDVQTKQDALTAAQDTATGDTTAAEDLLAAAANKPMADDDKADIKGYVDAQLEAGGILDYYRSLQPTSP